MATAKAKNLEAYKDTEILTANQGKLIVMLYEGAIRFLRIGLENMSHRTYDVVNTNVIKAQEIITELMLSLNMDEGGEIAQNLLNLYAYMKKRLLEGNISKDPAVLEEIVGLLSQLKEAWEDAAHKEITRPQPAQAGAPVRAGFSIQG